MKAINIETICAKCDAGLDCHMDEEYNYGGIALKIPLCEDCLGAYTQKIVDLMEIFEQISYELRGFKTENATKVIETIQGLVDGADGDV